MGSVMYDLQVYAPPWEVMMGSKCRMSVVAFPIVLTETSEPSTSWLSGPNHLTVGWRLEVTVQDREYFPPAERGLAGPETTTS